jgi:2-dehydropantoate 2-reductase
LSRTVAVLGPGAVGGVLAVPLVLSGHRVICVARPETAEAIAAEGLTLQRPEGTLHARPEAVARLQEEVDLLLVTVKSPALEDALGRIRAAVGLVVPLLNGLEHIDRIRARLGEGVIAGSIGTLEAFRDTPTRIVQTTQAPVITASAVVEPLQAAGFAVRVVPNERAVLWEKAARLSVLAAATALTQRTVGELRADPSWRPELETALAEACAVARADGVELTPASQWEIIGGMPSTLTTSTARDVAAGRPSELDAITGAVVRAGERLGVPTPTLRRILEDACRAPSR